MITSIRTGIGYDSHKFIEGRDLILCGVKIPYEYGLDGHSDADAPTHAIIDAIASPILHKDIGELFPNSDEKYKGANSIELLKFTYEQILAKNYRINNIDCCIIAEKPKLSPYKMLMREKLSEVLSLELEQVSIKAKTNEGMGFTGRKEGLMAVCVATLIK